MGDDLRDCASMNLRKTARLIAQFYDQRLKPGGIRITQFSLLVTLGYLAPVSITNLAGQMGIDRTTLSRNLRLLEREGLIEGVPGDDARVRMLSLTQKGQDAVRETKPYWNIAQTEFLEKFGKKRWKKLRSELTEVTKIISPG